MTRLLLFAIFLAACGAGLAGYPAFAGSGAATVVAAAEEAMAEGEVRKVDTEQGRITIRHGEIRNLQMPPMTMVFRVKDPAMLEKVKRGDRILFRAEQQNGDLVVTEIVPAP